MRLTLWEPGRQAKKREPLFTLAGKKAISVASSKGPNVDGVRWAGFKGSDLPAGPNPCVAGLGKKTGRSAKWGSVHPCWFPEKKQVLAIERDPRRRSIGRSISIRREGASGYRGNPLYCCLLREKKRRGEKRERRTIKHIKAGVGSSPKKLGPPTLPWERPF